MSGRNRGKRDQYGDDDGRTIADMSDIGRQGFFGRPAAGTHDVGSAGGAHGQSGDPERGSTAQDYREPLTKKERFLCALGALKAALLIGLAYIVGLGLVILGLIALWR